MLTPPASEAFALSVIVPETFAPAAGAVIETVGAEWLLFTAKLTPALVVLRL
jgi:hypothetical protein